MLFTGLLTALTIFAPPPDAAPTLPATCALLQRAFITFVAHDGEIYPAELAPARQGPASLAEIVPSYRKHMALAPGEFEDLEARQKAVPQGDFVPDCAWNGEAYVPPREGARALASFTRPVLSSDGKLALVEVSSSSGLSAGGDLCIMRLDAGRW